MIDDSFPEPCFTNLQLKQSAGRLVAFIPVYLLRSAEQKSTCRFCVYIKCTDTVQDQDQDSLLVKRRNDNHSPGPLIRELDPLVPSSHQRSELSNKILCIFSG